MSMKTLLLRIKRSLVCRLCYRLVCWINYPTSRERMWNMFTLGYGQGRKDALKDLPITQVQPAIPKIEIKPLHLPPGMWSKQYFEEHPERRPVIPSQPAYWPAPFEEQAWLNSKPAASVDPDNTEEMPAIVKLRHTRKLG